MRYLNAFFLTTLLYVSLATVFLFAIPFDDNKSKKEPEKKRITLNHIQIQKEPVEVPKEIEKVAEQKVEPIIEPKVEPIVEPIEKPKEVIKKVEPKKVKPKVKKETKDKVVKKKEIKETIEVPKEIEKVVEEKIIEKPIIHEEVKENVVTKANYEEDFLRHHLALIKKEIQKNIKYSQRARKLNIEGCVIVEFCLTKAGEIIDIKTIEGHKLLQKSTIEAIYSALENFPKVQRSVTIRVPIEYRLI